MDASIWLVFLKHPHLPLVALFFVNVFSFADAGMANLTGLGDPG